MQNTYLIIPVLLCRPYKSKLLGLVILHERQATVKSCEINYCKGRGFSRKDLQNYLY